MKFKVKNRAFQYFISNHGAFDYRRGWFRLPTCPFCGHTEKMSVNLRANRAHCFRCEYDDNLVQAVSEIEQIPTLQHTIKFLGNFEAVEYKEPAYEKIEEREVVLPQSFITIKRGDSLMGKAARVYLKKRGFNISTLSRMGVGYVTDSESKYYGYVIVPFHKDRKIVYFQTRKFWGSGPKFNNPPFEDFGVGKTQIIYNEKALRRSRELNLVESWTNAWTIGDTAVSINGKVLSNKQKSMILQSKSTQVNILLDLDAWEYAIKIGFDLVQYKNIRIIRFPSHDDVNDIGRDATIKLIEETPILKTHKEVIKLKNRY